MNDLTANLIGPALPPVLVLIGWTLIMLFCMVGFRLSAMKKADINPKDARHPRNYVDRLPDSARNIGDNYNHLHEQPTLFYALAFYLTLAGAADHVNVALLWGYVVSRIAHSIVQSTSNNVAIRGPIFGIGSLILVIIVIREALRLLG